MPAFAYESFEADCGNYRIIMNKILRKTLIAFVVILFIIQFSLVTYAENVAYYYGEDIVLDAVPDEIQVLLDEMGVNSLEFDSLFNIQLKDIWRVIKQLLTGSIESPLKSLVRLTALIVMLAVFECFIPEEHKIKSIMRLASGLLCVIGFIEPLSTAITSAVASVTVSENFMLILIPVLTAVVSVSGNPVLAASFQTIAFSAAQIISAVISKLFVPLIGIILAIDITGSAMPEFRLTSISSAAKKTVTSIISFAATLFVAFLGLKGGLANAADTFAQKGVKLVLSSTVPVVGGALSEAYSGVLGSILLAKSTIGVFGIAVIALINLPSCMQVLFWIFTLRIAAGVADLFDQDGISGLLRSVASSLVLLNVILVFVAVLFIISTVLILILKAR